MPKLLAVVLVCVVIGVVISIVYSRIIVPQQKYQSALSLMEAGDYDNAILAFNELDDEKYSEIIKECYYLEGESLFTKGNYTDAISSFEKAGDFKDAKEKIEDTKNERLHKDVITYLRSGKYYQAEPLIQELRNKGFQFSGDEETEIEYMRVIKKGAQSLSEAVEILKTLPQEYKNVSTLLQEAEELLKYEGTYKTSGTSEDYGYTDDEENYDVDFQIKFCLDEKEDFLARVWLSHTMVHNKEKGWDYEENGLPWRFPLSEGKHLVQKIGNDYYFASDNNSYWDGNYTATFKTNELIMTNDRGVYHAEKLKE